ncbi:hypothetical protein VTJ83DRAFT_6477 [Remersonia thermophila]|uniref:Uncharacterized protein n=1 Tax=Remersonia thermophila TaxID=72144 RepID=A0ABR4D4X3_9PEZI
MVRAFSIYTPRRRRSPRFILLYFGTFAFILLVTWYISTRHAETARPYVQEFLRPGSVDAFKAGRGGGGPEERKPVGGPVAAAKAAVDVGKVAAVRREDDGEEEDDEGEI